MPRGNLPSVVVDRPLAIGPATNYSGRPDVIGLIIILLLMAILTMRLVGRAVQPVAQLIRASAAMIGAMLLIAGMGVALVIVLIILLART